MKRFYYLLKNKCKKGLEVERRTGRAEWAEEEKRFDSLDSTDSTHLTG